MKRSYDEMNDSDEELLLGKRSLPVANLPRDFNEVPQDGMQYLFTVRRDARRLPNFTRANAPSDSAIRSSSPVKVKPNPSSETTPILPSDEWKAAFIVNFKKFRKNCELLRDSESPSPGSVDTFSAKIMPEKKERESWRAFIDGHPEELWNPPRKQKGPKAGYKGADSRNWKDDRISDSYNDLRSFEYGEAYGQYELDSNHTSRRNVHIVNEYGESYEGGSECEATVKLLTPSESGPSHSEVGKIGEPSNVKSGTQKIEPRQPTALLLHRMDNRYCLHLLMYFAFWIDMHLKQQHPKSKHLSQTDFRWIFALLSQVDAQLGGDELNQLRNLARSCFALIKDIRRNAGDYEASQHTTTEPVDEKACWLIVTAILEFWVQRDLWMDVEGMLRREV